VSEPAGDAQTRADALLRAQTAGLAPEAASYELAVLVNRAANELHKLARQEASSRRGAPDWGTWAALQNAARTLVLQASTCRDQAARLSGRAR